MSDRHVGGNFRGIWHDGCQATVAVWVIVTVPQRHRLNDGLKLLRSSPYVNLRESALQVGFVRSNHATHNREEPAWVPSFNCLQLAE